MKPLTTVLSALFITVVAVAIIIRLFGAGSGENSDGGTGVAPPPKDAIVLPIASSITKREWIHNAIALFNERSKTESAFQLDGKPLHVVMLQERSPLNPNIWKDYRSPTQVADTVSGIIEPVMLSPANGVWLEKLAIDWTERHGGVIMTEPAPPLLSTPIIIAMWESRGRALGCWPEPGPSCTWQAIIDLAKDPDGWGSLGHPEWGDLRIAYATVGESDVATLTVVMLCATGLQMPPSELGVLDAEPDNGCGEAIGDIEAKKPRAAPSSPVILDLMATNGPEYLHMATTYEKEVVAFNKNYQGQVREPLIAAYPQDGTIVADHPLAILDGAPWVEPEQVEGARLFQKFLLSAEQQAELIQYGLRPADSSLTLTSPIDVSHGANPAANLVVLDVPAVLATQRIVEVWDQVEKQADIVVVFDKSGSMSGQKMDQAVIGAKAFVAAMDGGDWLMWMPFDDAVHPRTEGKVSKVGEKLLLDISGTAAEGGTALYDAVGQAYEILEGRRKTQGDSRRYGIVVLSDGQNTETSQFTLTKLQFLLKGTEKDPTGIQIHTIGVGGDADEDVLTKIAAATQGRYWEPDVDLIPVIYRNIAKYF